MNVKLVVVGGKKAGLAIPVAAPKFRIGRGEHCHIRPQNDLVGDLHCVLSVNGSAVTLEDCGAAAGTFVNAKRVQQSCNLQNGDHIRVGALELEVRLGASDADEKKQPNTNGTAGHTGAASSDNDDVDDILRWAKQEQVVRPPPTPSPIVPPQEVKSETSSAAAQAAAALRAPKPVRRAEEDFELEPADRLLLLTIVPLAAILLSFLPTYWAWRGGGGILLAALAIVFNMRRKHAHGIRWDGLNVATCILMALVASLMLPMRWDWMWLGGGIVLLGTFSVILRRRMKQMVEDQWDDTNVALSAAVALLVYITVNQSSSAFRWGWLGGAVVFFVAASVVAWFGMKRMVQRGLDETSMATMAAIALLMFMVTKTWLPATHGVQLTGAIVPLATLTLVFGIRLFRLAGRRLDELNLLLLAQIGILVISVSQLAQPNLGAWRIGNVILLAAIVPLFAFRLIRMRGNRLNEVNLAILVQIGLLASFVFKQWPPSMLWSSILSWATQLRWPGWDVGSCLIGMAVVSLIVGVRMMRRAENRLDDANIALLAAIVLGAFIAIKMWPSVAQQAGLAGFVVPSVALAILFGIRLFCRPGSRLDGLNVLLLSLVGILTMSAIQFARPDWGAWRIGAVIFLAALVLPLCVRAIWPSGKLNEVNLTLLVQIVLLAVIVGNLWLPPAFQPSTLWVAALQSFKSDTVKSSPTPVTPTKLLAGNAPPAPVAAKTQPAISLPAKLELAKNTNISAKTPPAKAEPIKAPPIANQSIKVEPAKNASVGNTPAKMPVAEIEPDKVVANQSIKKEPAKIASAGNAPAKTLPAKEGLVKTPPNNNAPAKTPPAKAETAKLPPVVAQQPIKEEPTKNALAAKHPPVVNPPGKIQIARNAPAKAAPVKNAPAVNPPAKIAQPKTPPTNTVIVNNVPIKMQPSPMIRSLSIQEWAGFGGAIVPLAAVIALFGVRTNRIAGSKLDGLSLLLLSQIGILALSALHRVLPNVPIWQGGTVLLLVALVPLLYIHIVRIDGRVLNEINLALVVQIGLFVLFIANWWLPYLWTQITAGIILLAAIIPLIGMRKVWKKEKKLGGLDWALLGQVGMFAFFVADRWLPPFWVRTAEAVILSAALAILFKLQKGHKSDDSMLRWIAVGIVLIIILGFLFPIATWWPT